MDGSNKGGNHNREGKQPHDHHDIDLWAYSVAPVIIGGVVDFWFLWPESHLKALLAFAALICIPLVAEARKRRISYIHTIGSAVFCLACALVVYAVVGPVVPPDIEAGPDGWLIPGHERRPSNGCDSRPGSDKDLADERDRIILGGITIAPGNRMKRYTPLMIDKCPTFVMGAAEKGLLVSATDFDSDGNRIFTIKDGRYHAEDGQYAYLTRSPDRSRMTIYDRWGAEIAMFWYMNPTTVRVRGRFTCEGRKPIIISDNKLYDPEMHDTFQEVCIGG